MHVCVLQCVCAHIITEDLWTKNKCVCRHPLRNHPPPAPPVPLWAPCSTNHSVRKSKLQLMGGVCQWTSLSERKVFSVARGLKRALWEGKERSRANYSAAGRAGGHRTAASTHRHKNRCTWSHTRSLCYVILWLFLPAAASRLITFYR